MAIKTQRLLLEPLDIKHWALILAVFNDPDFVNFVGDKGIRTRAQAEDYLRQVPVAERHKSGINNYAVLEAKRGAPLGMCGLLQRAYLPQPDMGYGFLPAARGQGYAREAATAVLASLPPGYALWAMVNPNNRASLALLTKLAFKPYTGTDITVPHTPVQLLHKVI